MNVNFLQRVKDDTGTHDVFVGSKMEIYLPKSYFDSEFATTVENRIETIGIFPFKVEDKLYMLSLPIMMQFEYTDEDKFSGRIKPDIAPMDYRVFVLKKGDEFNHNCNHPESIDDLEFMFKTFIGNGKIPPFVKYNDSASILFQLLVSSGVNTGLDVSAVLLEGMLSQLYRGRNNIYQPYRKTVGQDSHKSQYDYRMVGLKKVPSLTSVFASVNGEDSSMQIANSILRHREHKEDIPNPMEDLIKY